MNKLCNERCSENIHLTQIYTSFTKYDMQQELSKIASGIRILIWGALLLQALWIGISALRADEPANETGWVPGGLWPGDWVPHPNLPEPQIPTTPQPA
jgi:hypothetical protein